MSIAQDWLNESEDNRRAFAQEGLIIEATEGVYELLEKRGKSKADLALLLGQSKGHVTQLLTGSRNMTLRTLADIAYMLGAEVKLTFVEAKHSQFANQDAPTPPASVSEDKP